MADDLLSMILQARQGATSKLGNYPGGAPQASTPGGGFQLDPSALEKLRASLTARMAAGHLPMPRDVLTSTLGMDSPGADVAKARAAAAANFMNSIRGGAKPINDDELMQEIGSRVGRINR